MRSSTRTSRPCAADLARDIRRLRRLTYLYGAVAVMALIAGAGAATWAAATIGSAQVINNSLRSVDIKNRQIKRSDLANSSVSAVKLAANSVSSRELAKVPAVRVARKESFTVPTGFGGALVSFSSEKFDTSNMWTSSSGSTITIPRTGIYVIAASMSTSDVTAETVSVFAQIETLTNGVLDVHDYGEALGDFSSATVTSVLTLTAGTTVQLHVVHVSGATQTMDSATMSAAWIGPAS